LDLRGAVKVSNESPVLLDRFLDLAIEVDVDAICDGEDVLIGGIMEHVEQAGVHSGDSSCSLPPTSLSAEIQDELRDQTRKMALALNVVGLMNVQFAIQNGIVYVLEVNPRASRTVPFVSKATGRPLAKIAARVMAGRKLADLDATVERVPPYFSVKEAVFPFGKFPESDPILGPEMKSTGEVMGTGRTFGEAYAKSQAASGIRLPTRGVCLVSVRDRDKEGAIAFAKRLLERGFEIIATQGTQAALEAAALPAGALKVREGRRIVDMTNPEIDLIINTTEAACHPRPHSIRREASCAMTYYTTVAAANDLMRSITQDHGQRLQDLADRAVRRPSRLRAKPAYCALKGEDRAIIRAIAEARSHGDLSENAEYHAAREQQGFIEGRIKEIEQRLADAQVIDPASLTDTGKVVFGATVELAPADGGPELCYQIVGDDEADIKSGLLSINSPIARALIGRSPGDEVEVLAPGGARRFEVLAVRLA
jgi:carbamoyl-phosphate synthase large subunit